MKTFTWNALRSFSSLVAIVIKGLMKWGSKCHQNNSPVVCDGYVKYEEAEVDKLEAAAKVAADRVEYSKQRAKNLIITIMWYVISP